MSRAARRTRRWARTPLVLALPAASALAALVCVLGLVLLGVPVLGLAGGPDERREQADAAPPPTGEPARAVGTPARAVLVATFAEVPRAWSTRGALLEAASVPHPLSCVRLTPAASASRGYEVDGASVQLTLAAYGAGLGAEALGRMTDEADGCAPGGLRVSGTDLADLGSAAVRLRVSGPGTDYTIVAWRRGDVVAFAAGTEADVVQATATRVDEVLAGHLAGPCLDQEPTREDALRNAGYAGAAFTGRTEKVELRTARVPLPELPVEYLAAGVEATSLDEALPELAEVTVPDPPEHPHALALPQPRTRPAPPAPVVAQVTEMAAPRRVPDPTGPGCGWAFTRTAEPRYSAPEAAAANRAAEARTREALEADGARWRADVLAYWVAVHEYRREAAAWQAYASEVARVAASWAEVERQWAEYETAAAAWAVAQAERERLMSAQASAREQYAAELAQCESWFAVDPEGLDYALGCPPSLPAVLAEQLPDPGPEPTPPATG